MPGTRARRFAVASLIALLFGVVGGWALSRSSDDVDANLTDPGVTQYPGIPVNTDISGETFGFVGLVDVATGEKVVPAAAGRPMVVNFWFSTCEPCRREMPVLAAGAAEWAGKVDFIGVNPNDTRESATGFMERNGVTYPNYLDDAGEQMAAAKVGTMPTTYFLDGTGRVVSMHAGELSESDLREAITALGVNA